MPTKWTEPKGKPPSWLDEADEYTGQDPKLDRSAFTVACVDQLVRLGVPLWQAFEVTGNSINETGGGQFYRANNLGGWKCTKGFAEAYRKKHGRGPAWWRAPGNKAPGATLKDFAGGDPPWCWYRAFDSIGDYLAEWVAKFTPRPDPKWTAAFVDTLEKRREATGDYRLTGYLFWRGDPAWFVALCDAGYKGANTDQDPQPSYREHLRLVRGAKVRWAQSKLRVAADGQWGPKSRAACEAFQRDHALPATGEPDEATLASLAVT